MALTRVDNERINQLLSAEILKAKNISQHLLHAPKAACMIKTLSVIAHCTVYDPSLRTGAPGQEFKVLRRPESFRASLYQVINAMTDAFSVGDRSVASIQSSLMDMPIWMNDILEAITKPASPAFQRIIEKTVDNITAEMKSCIETAKKPEAQFEAALAAIRELAENAKAVDGSNQNRNEEIKNQKKIQEEQKEKMDAEKKRREMEAFGQHYMQTVQKSSSLIGVVIDFFTGSETRKVEYAKDIHRQASEQYARTCKELEARNAEIRKIYSDLKNLNLEEINLKDILYYLREGIAELVKAQDAWQYLVKFFQHINDVVQLKMKYVQRLVKEAKKQKTSKNAIDSEVYRGMVRDCISACAVGSVLMQTTKVYQIIASDCVRPIMSKALLNMGLSREKAKELQQEVENEFGNMEAHVNGAIQKQKMALENEVAKDLRMYGFDVSRAVQQ